jgi:hypothetical protein
MQQALLNNPLLSMIVDLELFSVVSILAAVILLAIGFILKTTGATKNTLRKYIISALVIFGILNTVIWILFANNLIRTILENKDTWLDLYRH